MAKWTYPDEIAISKEGTLIKVYQYGEWCASFDLANKQIEAVIYSIGVAFDSGSIQGGKTTFAKVKTTLGLL